MEQSFKEVSSQCFSQRVSVGDAMGQGPSWVFPFIAVRIIEFIPVNLLIYLPITCFDSNRLQTELQVWC